MIDEIQTQAKLNIQKQLQDFSFTQRRKFKSSDCGKTMDEIRFIYN